MCQFPLLTDLRLALHFPIECPSAQVTALVSLLGAINNEEQLQKEGLRRINYSSSIQNSGGFAYNSSTPSGHLLNIFLLVNLWNCFFFLSSSFALQLHRLCNKVLFQMMHLHEKFKLWQAAMFQYKLFLLKKTLISTPFHPLCYNFFLLCAFFFFFLLESKKGYIHKEIKFKE